VSAIQVLQTHSSVFIGVIGLLGLLVGSFLNVVVHRLPIMMRREWRKECQEYLEISEIDTNGCSRFDLIKPDSHCTNCNHTILPHENIPLLSFIFLKGRCVNCKSRISLRYPAVELFSAASSAIVAWHFGFGLQTAFALMLTWALISASLIDLDHQLLPDTIVLPILWLGLLISVIEVFVDSQSSIIGASAGWLCLWLVYHAFKFATGKEGMGYGDFKLLALLGAWLGWQVLPIIILLSSLVGAIVGIVLILFFRHQRSNPIPFGPFLAAAGWIALLWGDDLTGLYWSIAF